MTQLPPNAGNQPPLAGTQPPPQSAPYAYLPPPAPPRKRRLGVWILAILLLGSITVNLLLLVLVAFSYSNIEQGGPAATRPLQETVVQAGAAVTCFTVRAPTSCQPTPAASAWPFPMRSSHARTVKLALVLTLLSPTTFDVTPAKVPSASVLDPWSTR